MAHNDGPKGAGDPHPTSELPEVRDASSRRDDAGRSGDDAGRERDAGRDRDATPPVVVNTGGGFLRGLFWLTGTLALVVAIVLGATAIGLMPKLKNPFGSKTTDRSQPVVLKSIQDLSRFVAAEGNFQVIVDLQNDKKYVPEFLVNDRTLFVAAGTVEAYVDFGTIGQGALVESPDRKSVEIKLPAPQLNRPNIDHEKSYVFAQQRGLLNRLGEVFSSDPNKLQELYKLSEQKITDAARSSGLAERAQENTRKMLDQMLRALGYTTVTVTFTSP